MNESADPSAESVPDELGWRFRRTDPSLPEVFRSVSIPRNAAGWMGFIRKLLAFSGPGAMALGVLPSPALLHNREMLYVAIGILGATVMPHNLYLHSSIAQTRH